MSPFRFRIAPLAGCAALAFGGVAHAGLGGSLASVKSDSQRIAAPATSTAMSGYTRHDLTRVNGGRVHEFTNADGQVFAVTWSGPGKPDLRTLLGGYFATMQSADVAAGRTMHALRRPVGVDQSDLQIQTGGHMGWFHGVAFIPSLAPAGFAVHDLAKEN